MTIPTVIVKNGKRYVKIGKKRVKVDSSLTERELIQWMIKHFKPKRRVKKSREKDAWVAPPASKAIVLPSVLASPSQNREFKEQLEDTQKKLKAALDEVKQLPPSKQEDGLAKYSPEQVKQVMQIIEDQEAEVQRQKGIRAQEKENADRLLKEEKEETAQERAKRLQSDKARRAAERKPLQESLAYYDAALAKISDDTGGMDWDQIRAFANSNNVSAAGTRADILMAITKKKEELAREKAKVMADLDKIVGDGRAVPVDIPPEGISDLDINRAMKDHKQFLGAIAADEIHALKAKDQKRICWIQNTESRAHGGIHWVAFFIDARPHGTQSVEYYDPLGDPIGTYPSFLRDVKVMIKQVHDSNSYLKFRENKIPDQSDISNNCGPFCLRFLQARLAGESFAKATGWDKQGEKNIELWKRHPKQQMWISGQTGEGLRDIFDKVRKGATKIYERIKATLSGPRGGAPPAVRGWLAKYGDVEIQNVWVCKKPIFSILESIGNWLSSGKLRENMDRLGYDRLMHLYMIVQLKGGPTVKIEKNHVVEIKNSGDLGQKHMGTGHPSTVNQMIKTAEASHGEAVWKYHLVDANCQKFIMWCLGSQASPGVREFVMQDVASSLKDMGLLQKIATVVTDVAGAADVAINGAGN